MADLTVEVDSLTAQRSLVADRSSRIVALIGGYGSGKTMGAALKAIALGLENAPCVGLVVAPTYSMVRDVVLRTFVAVLQRLGIPFKWHRTEHVLTVGVGYRQEFDVLLRSGDSPERLVGLNVAWAIIDEPGVQKEEVAEQVLARIRDPRAKVKQLVFTGTPEGMNWLYDWTVAKPGPGTRLIRARTRDNPHLDPAYVENLRARFTPEEVEMYLDGEFVVLEGGIYRSFRRTEHGRPCQNPLAGDLVVGADFNVGKMVWIIGRALVDEGHVWGELVRENTNTFEQTEALVEYLRDHVEAIEGVRPSAEEVARRTTVYADASGEHRRTSSSKSDLAILREAGFRVVVPSKNPPVRDRIATVNDRLRRGRLFVDSQGCPDLVRSLEQHAYDEHGQPDKTKGLDHAVDAIGYLCWMRPGWRVTSLKGNQTSRPHFVH